VACVNVLTRAQEKFSEKISAADGVRWDLPHNQLATPPWCEHVPRRLLLKLYVPSRHRAVAPAGAAEQFSGRLTVCPLLFTYLPLSVHFGGCGFGCVGEVCADSAGDSAAARVRTAPIRRTLEKMVHFTLPLCGLAVPSRLNRFVGLWNITALFR